MSHLDWMIVGLGNPGSRYAMTRHNLGFWVIDVLDRSWSTQPWHEDAQTRYRFATKGAQRVMLVKPLLYMNRSGEALAPLWKRCSLPCHRLIVVHDDKDLPEGKLRLRPGGSDGGHKGIRSLIETVSDPSFLRVRIGVGAPPDEVATSDFILEQIDASRVKEFEGVAQKAAEAIEAIIHSGIHRAMNMFNRTILLESGKERLP